MIATDIVVGGSSSSTSTSHATKLYDRKEQLLQLTNAFERCCFPQVACQREVVVITGPPGAGKTALAYELKDRVEANEGYFCAGKFCQLAHAYRAFTKSYEPFVSALTDFCNQLATSGENHVKLLKSLLQEALTEDELSVLEHAIPAVGTHLLGRQNACSDGSGAFGYHAESRFVNIFCRFVNILAKQQMIVLLLDDIQWADPKSMELLATLAGAERKADGSSLMILCTCRADENTSQNNVPTIMNELCNRGVTMTNISVWTVSKAAVNEIIADRFQLSAENRDSLASLVHSKTEGNIFFVFQALQWWQETPLQDDCEQIEWNEKYQSFQAMEIQFQLLSNKIEQLPVKVKQVIKVAACLGPVFEEKIVWAVGTADKAEVAAALRVGEETELICLDHESGTGRFVHDKIQQAVYSQIPETERALFRLDLGRRLFPCLPPSVMDKHLLLIADLIATGSHLVVDSDEKKAFAELYLRASQKAAMSSAIADAAAYLQVGINLLGVDKWTSHYNLTLTLYNKAAEFEYYNGNLDVVDELVAEVCNNAKTFDATLKVQFTRIYSLGTRGDIHAAVDEGLTVLKKLGESFPSHITSFHVQLAMARCRRTLQETSKNGILSIPPMTDATKIIAMRLMLVVACFSMSARKGLLPLIVLRAITHTLTHGMNDMCCAAFSTLSWLLTCRGYLDDAARAGDIAMSVFDHRKDKEWRARVFGFVYGGIRSLQYPYKESLTPLLGAHRSALVLGDIHLSLASALMYSGIALYSGVTIPQVAKETLTFQDLIIRYRLMSAIPAARATLQVLHKLSGKSASGLIWTDDVSTMGDSLQSIKTKHPLAYQISLFYMHFLAVYLDDMSEVQHVSALIQKSRHGDAYPFHLPTFHFLDGLVAARSALSSSRARKRANSQLAQLKKYAQFCPQNFQNKVCLLEAELLAGTASPANAAIDDALAKYETSIELAAQQGLIHEQALASERAAFALLNCGRSEEARDYLMKARCCYFQWGAQAKVDQIQELIITM